MVRQWRIVRDDDGTPHTECPRCEARDSIREHDTAVRWNTLRLAGDGQTATASLGDAGDWDGDGWICAECLTTELDAPDGFEVTDWY